MKKVILAGLLLSGSLINVANANTQENMQINQESFDLMKSALIRILKENKELKERILDLEDKTQRNADNILMVTRYLKPKVESIMLAQKRTPKYVAGVETDINTNVTRSTKESKQILKLLDEKKMVRVSFVRDSNVRDKAGLSHTIVNRFKLGERANIVNYQRVDSNLWYELEQGGFTHFHNVEFIEEARKKTQTTQEEAQAEQTNASNKEISTLKDSKESQKPNLVETKTLPTDQESTKNTENTTNKGE